MKGQREEQLKKRVGREQIARRQAEEKARQFQAVRGGAKDVKIVRVGPEYEEGPHSQLGEDEFYDAVETALDKYGEELEKKDKLEVLVG